MTTLEGTMMPSNVATVLLARAVVAGWSPWDCLPLVPRSDSGCYALAGPCFRVVATAGLVSVDDLWLMVAHVMPLASCDDRPKL